jgi:hypothetical protein
MFGTCLARLLGDSLLRFGGWSLPTPPAGTRRRSQRLSYESVGPIGVAKGGTAPPDLDPEMLTGAPLTFPAMLRGFLYANMLANHA